jgi:hypothetical protein
MYIFITLIVTLLSILHYVVNGSSTAKVTIKTRSGFHLVFENNAINYNWIKGDFMKETQSNIGIYISIFLYIHLSIYPSFYISIFLYIHLSIYPSFYISIFQSIHLSIYPSFYISIFLYIHLSIYPSFYISIFLSIRY